MTLIIQKPTGAKLNLRKTWQPMDSDAAAYITAVETADGQALEERTKIAIDNFVLGCKADGIWSAIKASCILAGARTLAGALVPLVGTAPTNINFVSGDYNRETGLKGNGSSKRLDSNRNNNADPQDNKHVSVFSTERETRTADYVYIGSDVGSGGTSIRSNAIGQTLFQINCQTFSTQDREVSSSLLGANRASSAGYVLRLNSSNITINTASQTPDANNLQVFSRRAGLGPTDARIAFYSIGESLNLALLDARVTDLIDAFAAAIP